MKAISLWQPWASAIAIGAKRIETRSWRTSYRGPLLIHASKHQLTQLEFMQLNPGLSEAVREFPTWPRGYIVAVANLFVCLSTEWLDLRGEICGINLDQRRKKSPFFRGHTERMLGDFRPGRWGWVLRDVKALVEPIPYSGRQGLFEIPDDPVLSVELRALWNEAFFQWRRV